MMAPILTRTMKRLLILPIILTAVIISDARDTNADEPPLEDFLDFVHNTREYAEGFSQSTGSNDFSYHSIRSDITDCLLTRATNGQMDIEWLTAPVPSQPEGKGVGFLWIAAMDVTSVTCSFDVYLNGVRRFTISSGNRYDWTMEGNDGGSLTFFNKEKDQHGDAHGYMALWAPWSWLEPGKPQKIKIIGEAAGSNTWIIVFKATDAADYLQRSAQYDKWIRLEAHIPEGQNELIKVSTATPEYFAGENLWFTTDNVTGAFRTEPSAGKAVGQFELPASGLGKPLRIHDMHGELALTDALGEPGSSTVLLHNTILQVHQEAVVENEFTVEAQRIYSPKTVKSLDALARSGLSEGKIYLMNSSHQDIAWMDSPEKCVLERDTMLLTPLFELASRDPDYRFDIEDALMLKEYIQRHPEKRPLIGQMLSDGRISCGATYIQPYEEMYSGESLARQFYFGARWLKDEFNYKARVYWNVDVPGRTLQMPQIMKKAGADYLMMSRFEKGIYHWFSPDGSYITAFSPGHYADAFRPLQKNFYDAAQYVGQSSLYWEKYFPERSEKSVVPVLSDWDMSPAVDYSAFIEKWETIDELQDEAGNFIPVSLPHFSIASGPEFFDALSDGAANIAEIHGERPALWLYIHGPSHQKALKASREGDILLTQAEKFAVVNAWLDGSFKAYPGAELSEAWEAKIYPDHGWGGKNGEITDNLFLQKYQTAKNQGERILEKTLSDISSRIKTRTKKGIPVVVFNSLSWSRSDVAHAKVNFDQGEAWHIALIDAEKKTLPVQITEKSTHPDGSLKSAEICFIADRVPSIGYKAFYCIPAEASQPTVGHEVPVIENDFYKLRFADGGIGSIYDKQLQQELVNASKFKAGEVFTMRSVGNGAGEFSAVQQPDMEGFDKTGNYATHWILKQDGPVFTSFEMRQQIRNAVVVQEVVVYHTLKRIDFLTEILNWEGILYREYRFALPLNMADGKVVYEVPYGVLEVGKDEMEGHAGERYNVPCRDIHPRGIQNWIGAYNDSYCTILSSSVAVADYIDPTDDPMASHMLQPVLIASRKSCHGEGNDYLQTGDHSFRFCLTSSEADWKKSYRTGIQANEPLRVVVGAEAYRDALLPEEKSFITLSTSNVMISALKMAEDGTGTVVRLVEMEGKDTIAKLDTYLEVNQLQQASLIEDPLKDIDISDGIQIKLGHHAIETMILK